MHTRGESSRPEAEMAAERIRDAGGTAEVRTADLTRVEEIDQLFANVEETHGGLDVLVNNAGWAVVKPMLETSEEDFDRLFAINTKAAFFCMKAAAKIIRDGGRIVSLTSTLVRANVGLRSAYAGSKAPLEAFSRALAHELGPRGVTVNVVGPGPLDDDFMRRAEAAAEIETFSAFTPLGRLGTVDEAADVVAFLCSPQGRWVNCQTILVNGGFVAA